MDEHRSPHKPQTERPALAPSLILTVGLLGLLSLSIELARSTLGMVMILAVVAQVTAFYYLFKASRFFAFVLANLTGVYACLYLFFVETNFAAVDRWALWPGFVAPLAAFFGGSLWRRREIRQLFRREPAATTHDFRRLLLWLVPIFAIGGASFLMPEGSTARTADVALLGSMALIAAVVLLVSRDVAVFLLDTGLFFEEFFARAARLAAPAFAFFTFYSLLVIVFGAVYSLIDRISLYRQFRIDGALKPITFSESLYFSITTLSTVGYGDITPATNLMRMLVAVEIICGILLLLVGVNEILTYARERGSVSRRPPE